MLRDCYRAAVGDSIHVGFEGQEFLGSVLKAKLMCEASRQETSFETSLLVYAHSVLWIRVRELSRCQVCCAAQCGGSGHLPAEPPQPDTGGVGVHGCPHPLGASAECSLRFPDIRSV